MNGLDEVRAYFFGALLGDGHIRYSEEVLRRQVQTGGRDGPSVVMKVTDLDFATRWNDAIGVMTGKARKISVLPQKNPKHRTQYLVRCGDRALAAECERLTKHRTVIPDEVASYSLQAKKAFVIGLMDAEGWVNVKLVSLGQCDLTLGFGCGDPWFLDFVELVKSLGIGVSKVYLRPVKQKRNGEDGRQFRLIKLDILDYVNAGLSFTIRRKADRLAFASRILIDYTRDYPRYADYFGVDDIVSPPSKAGGTALCAGHWYSN